MIGVEALLRWDYPDRGAVAPAEFIPVAEESGLIVAIGDWVLRTACREAARWPGPGPVGECLAGAVSASGTLSSSVQQALAEAHIRADQLELEITEGVLIANTTDALRTLVALKDMGVRIAMDDFGTGYSSLSYLQKFPLDKIKIDRSFVATLCEDNSAHCPRDHRARAEPGHADLRRGRRDGRAGDLLRREGCKQAQGFLFGHAMEPTLIDELVASSGNNRGPPASHRRLSAPPGRGAHRRQAPPVSRWRGRR